MNTTNTDNIVSALIPADLTKKVTVVELNPDSPLESMYAAMTCRMVTPLPLMATPNLKGMLLWADEEGLCIADPKLNLRASILHGREIYGDVILAGDDGEKIVDLKIQCPAILFDLLQQEAEKIDAELRIVASHTPKN